MAKNGEVTRFRFGGFQLQTVERRVLLDGQPVNVGPRAFDLLVALAGRAGKLVSKDELLALVWPNLVVEENNLQVQVSALRKILGDKAIATIPGRGYRFMLDVTGGVVKPPLPAVPRHNLPQQVTSFVGRGRALTAVKELLAKSRLQTLVGFGGIGKTRLALQVAAEITGDYPDGVWFVQLAPLTDVLMVPQAVASVLGVREAAGRPVLEALLRFVSNRRLLVIIDSCEHLLHACAELAKQMLHSAPHLKILATSRERLNLAGETTYAVSALAMPEPNQSIKPATLTEYEAVRLFVERAVAALPAFHVTEQNVASVSDICAHVDGIPLALELAAARLRTMSVDNLAERLGDRLRLLTRGDPTAAPRQQSVRALIDWSYDLLTEDERALLRGLAVFAGGWTLEAAEAIVAVDCVDTVEVLDLLGELVEKSLVVRDAAGDRFRLLDTVREYALERLKESGSEGRVRAQHLGFYVAFAEKTRPELFRAEQGKWIAGLDLDRENLLRAHAWCEYASGGAELGLRLAYALKPYWFKCGLLGLGHRVTVEALARAGAEERNLTRCRALLDAGQLLRFMGRHVDARGYLEECLAIAREIGNKDRAGAALRLLGQVSYDLGEKATARRQFEEALALAREVDDRYRIAEAVAALAGFHRAEGNFAAAELLFREGLVLSRKHDDLEAVSVDLANLAMVSISRGSAEGAPEMMLEMLAIVDRAGLKWAGQLVIAVSTGLAAFYGEWRRAARLYGAARMQNERMGIVEDPASDTCLAPLLARTRESLDATDFAAAEAAGRALSYDSALAEVRAWLREVGGTRRGY